MQYGCQLVENNVSRVAHSKVTEGTVQFLAPFIVAVDEFGVRQLDKVHANLAIRSSSSPPPPSRNGPPTTIL